MGSDFFPSFFRGYKLFHPSSWWLVPQPILKNMLVKMGSSSQKLGVKIKNIRNHHLSAIFGGLTPFSFHWVFGGPKNSHGLRVLRIQTKGDQTGHFTPNFPAGVSSFPLLWSRFFRVTLFSRFVSSPFQVLFVSMWVRVTWKKLAVRCDSLLYDSNETTTYSTWRMIQFSEWLITIVCKAFWVGLVWV